MPIIKSAKKAARQALSRRDRNYLVRTGLRKSIRAVMEAVKLGEKSDAEKLLKVAYKTIDTATKKHVLPKNTAARRKSLLARKIAGIKGESSAK